MNIEEKVDELVSRGYEFKTGEYISDAWVMFKENAGVFIGYNLLLLVIGAVIGGVLSLIPIIGPFANLAISIPLNVGFFIVLNQIYKGEDFSINQLFDGFKSFGPLLGTSILGGLIIFAGMIFFVLPGIYLSIVYSFISLIVIFLNVSGTEALKASRKVLSKKFWPFFWFLIVLGLINLLGVLCIGFGLLVTIPLSKAALFLAFKDIFDKEGFSGAERDLDEFGAKGSDSNFE